MRLVAGLLAVGGLTVWAAPANADGTTCSTEGTLEEASQICRKSPEEAKAMILGDTEGHLWQLVRQCAIGGAVTCGQATQCGNHNPPQWMYTILRDGLIVGSTCLTDDQADELGVLTPGAIQRAFKAMTWPPAELTIQPPGGQTLVNLDTIFYTTTNHPTTQTVTLLGTQVTIQATPITYQWHHGDNTSQQTTDPGHPYPHHTITHTYTHTATNLPVQVDVTYQGRFHLPNQPWQPIPDTLTINGTPELLTVRQAQPHLTDTN